MNSSTREDKMAHLVMCDSLRPVKISECCFLHVAQVMVTPQYRVIVECEIKEPGGIVLQEFLWSRCVINTIILNIIWEHLEVARFRETEVFIQIS